MWVLFLLLLCVNPAEALLDRRDRRITSADALALVSAPQTPRKVIASDGKFAVLDPGSFGRLNCPRDRTTMGFPAAGPLYLMEKAASASSQAARDSWSETTVGVGVPDVTIVRRRGTAIAAFGLAGVSRAMHLPKFPRHVVDLPKGWSFFMYYQAGVGQVRCRMVLRTDPLFTNGQVPSGYGPCLDPQTSTCPRSERYSLVNDLFLVLSLQGVRALTVPSHSNLKMGTLITTLVRPLPNFNTKPCTDMLEQVNQVLPAGAGHDAALTELKDGLRSLFCRGCEKQQVDGVHNAQDLKLLRGAYLKALNGVSPRQREAELQRVCDGAEGLTCTILSTELQQLCDDDTGDEELEVAEDAVPPSGTTALTRLQVAAGAHFEIGYCPGSGAGR